MKSSLLTSLWAVAMVFASTWYFANSSGGQASGEEHNKDTQTFQMVEFDTISVSVFREGQVTGYLLVDVAVEVDASLNNSTNIPLEIYLRNELISALQADNAVDVANIEGFDFEEFQSRLAESIRTSTESEYVKRVLIARLDYLSKEEIRDLQLRRG